jgi:hypothetical protein
VSLRASKCLSLREGWSGNSNSFTSTLPLLVMRCMENGGEDVWAENQDRQQG